ncbi:GNAT family N-acetyltransferase [Xenorhabdus bovienii]|uniref:GNAT family N-acetyltransferase n=2 Tax=Xenorhabdus bovienii TaxID=40576 RepID=A0AAJ1J6A9_XENBV|nr:GNAT family protein [Xenorhabdus bovienii]MDE1474335.1 GNAT family N-acetyltransferase [Xenorhabdus bovienii]MDE1477989.1 GNAT family N-acetyltransferase [Xenorhabdus bovienii]MDE1491776.1 GNAT family N-acetyltransferase [Xenorhabdus bovienii]MDE1497239.1 GNAT family N-acetyltransferase [Xenorhabdus bovienii]MDE9457753.1 GNAT family N-acetyltransferase [Xenorhabdus bovienii]
MFLEDNSLLFFTSRLILRQFEIKDFAKYQSYHSLPEVYKFLYSYPPEDENMHAQFNRVMSPAFNNNGDEVRLAVILRENNDLAGEIMLRLTNKESQQGEIGCIFHPLYQRKSIGTESLGALIDISFEYFRCHRLYAKLDVLNLGSKRLVEKLGMRQEAHLLQNEHVNGIWSDMYMYAILHNEWQAPKFLKR